MNREFLKGLGLDDASIDKVMAEHGKTVESHKTKAADLQISLDGLNEQLKQRDKDLKDLKDKAKGSEELQQKLTDLQSKYDTEKSDFETKLKDTQLFSALKLALAGKVHDADLVTSLIDKATIELDADGNVTKGLDEQLKTLQESKSFLFVPDQKETSSIFRGFNPLDGKKDDGKEKDKSEDFGKSLAQFSTGNADLEKARDSYFG